MRQMSSYSDDTMFNPILFEQTSGPLFNGAEGPMNGDEQEDAYDFIQKLLPEFGAGELFEAVFKCKKSCWKCGKRCQPSLQGQSCFLKFQKTENKVEFEHVLSNCLKDHSIFEFEKLQCDGCNEVGEWVDVEGWSGKAGNRP